MEAFVDEEVVEFLLHEFLTLFYGGEFVGGAVVAVVGEAGGSLVSTKLFLFLGC